MSSLSKMIIGRGQSWKSKSQQMGPCPGQALPWASRAWTRPGRSRRCSEARRGKAIRRTRKPAPPRPVFFLLCPPRAIRQRGPVTGAGLKGIGLSRATRLAPELG